MRAQDAARLMGKNLGVLTICLPSKILIEEEARGADRRLLRRQSARRRAACPATRTDAEAGRFAASGRCPLPLDQVVSSRAAAGSESSARTAAAARNFMLMRLREPIVLASERAISLRGPDHLGRQHDTLDPIGAALGTRRYQFFDWIFQSGWVQRPQSGPKKYPPAARLWWSSRAASPPRTEHPLRERCRHDRPWRLLLSQTVGDDRKHLRIPAES